jgi:magnesium transporter
VSIEKHRLASMLRVPMRDLRMLEPNFSNSYSAAILCRERCIVLHLEQVRLLITAEEVRYNQNQNRSHIPADDESAPAGSWVDDVGN